MDRSKSLKCQNIFSTNQIAGKMKRAGKVAKYFALGYAGIATGLYGFQQLKPTNPFYQTMSPYLLPIQGVLVRSPKSLVTFAYIFSKYKTLKWWYDNKEEDMARVNEGCAKLLLNICMSNGGIWIKMGQVMASMRGFLPDIYCDILAECFNKVPHIDFVEIRNLLREELGGDIEKFFSEFDEVPIASASLAQVHRARTMDGMEVAVKVQYPKVKYYYLMDFNTSEIIRKVADYVQGKKQRPDIEEKINGSIKLELDFVNEIKNQILAKESLKILPYIYVPTPVPSLSTKRVLTMEFIHGVRGNDIEGMKKAGYSLADIATKLFTAMAEQIFTIGLVHADPHSGNFLVRPDPRNSSNPQIVLLDHGLYNVLSEKFRLKYCEFWNALVLRDTVKVKEYCTDIGINNAEMYTMIILMQNAGDNIGPSTLHDADHEGYKVTESDMNKWGEMEVTHKHDIDNITENLPAEMVFLFRAAFLLRGVNQMLGSPVNRFTIFARVASKNINVQDRTTWSGWFKSIHNQLKFEINLKILEFTAWLVGAYMRLFGMPQI